MTKDTGHGGGHHNYNVFPDIIKKSGPPTPSFEVFPNVIEQYRYVFPSSLIEMWETYGWGGYKHRRAWLCDPGLLRPIVEEIFQGDPDIDPDKTHPFAYDAFGRFLCWNDDLKVVDTTFLFEEVNYATEEDINYDPEPEFGLDGGRYGDDMLISNGFEDLGVISESVEGLWVDENGRPMMKQAEKHLGKLEYGEIYGFFPALKLGGENRVEYLKKVKVREHLMYLASISDLKLIKFSSEDYLQTGDGTTVVRPIGPQYGSP